jgi:hypothetical protein
VASSWNDENSDESGSDKGPFDQHSGQFFGAGSDNGSVNSLQDLPDPDPDDLTDCGYGFWDKHFDQLDQEQDPAVLLPDKPPSGASSPRKRKGGGLLPEPSRKKGTRPNSNGSGGTRLSAYHLQHNNGSATSASSQSHQQGVDKQTADLFSIDWPQLLRERELHQERAKNLKCKCEKIRYDAKKIKKLERHIGQLQDRLGNKEKELSRELDGNDFLNRQVQKHCNKIDRLQEDLEESQAQLSEARTENEFLAWSTASALGTAGTFGSAAAADDGYWQGAGTPADNIQLFAGPPPHLLDLGLQRPHLVRQSPVRDPQ